MTIFATNEENDEMREIIENALDTDEVRGCCYELLALNIVIDKVQPLIRSIEDLDMVQQTLGDNVILKE